MSRGKIVRSGGDDLSSLRSNLFHRMKHIPLSKPATALAALFCLAGLAQAHPGHSAFDWQAYLPHSGHEGEYAAAVTTAALVGLMAGMCWLASRRQ